MGKSTIVKMKMLAAMLAPLLLAALPAFAGGNGIGQGADNYRSNKYNGDGNTLPTCPGALHPAGKL